VVSWGFGTVERERRRGLFADPPGPSSVTSGQGSQAPPGPGSATSGQGGARQPPARAGAVVVGWPRAPAGPGSETSS
jgi:hypothetical protein